MKKILSVVGARPNFMKVAPIQRQMRKINPHFQPLLIHTGQHYDKRMSKLFFEDLQLPEPDVYPGIPCLTIRENTEHPVTVELGTNEVVNTDVAKIVKCAMQILSGNWKKGKIPELWDGFAAERIVNILTGELG